MLNKKPSLVASIDLYREVRQSRWPSAGYIHAYLAGSIGACLPASASTLHAVIKRIILHFYPAAPWPACVYKESPRLSRLHPFNPEPEAGRAQYPLGRKLASTTQAPAGRADRSIAFLCSRRTSRAFVDILISLAWQGRSQPGDDFSGFSGAHVHLAPASLAWARALCSQPARVTFTLPIAR